MEKFVEVGNKIELLFEIGTCLHMKKGEFFQSISITLWDGRVVLGTRCCDSTMPIDVITGDDVLYNVEIVEKYVESLLHNGLSFVITFMKNKLPHCVLWTIQNP